MKCECTDFVNLATGNMRAPANPVTADTPVRRPRVDSETPWGNFSGGLAHGLCHLAMILYFRWNLERLQFSIDVYPPEADSMTR